MMLSLFTFIAQGVGIGQIGEGAGLGPFSQGSANPAGALAGIISKIIGVITVAAGIWFIIQFLIGAIKWITSEGDKGKVEQAKDHLTIAVIGLGIGVAAYVVAGLMGLIFGVDILNPQNILPNLKF